MEFQFLIDLLLRRKWLILVSVIIPAIAAFLLVSTKDRTYKSEALLSTGIIGTGLNIEQERSYIQDVLIKMDFGSRVEKLKGASMIRLLGYQMLLHDLEGKKRPFRSIDTEDEDAAKYTTAEVQTFLRDIRIQLDTLNTKVLEIEQERLFKDLSKALEYDYKSITENLNVYRRGDTDNIGIDFKSDDSYLSSYLINQLLEHFLRLNKYEQEKAYRDNYEFAQEQADGMQANRDTAEYNLTYYRTTHSVVDLEAQSTELVKRIEALEEEEVRENTNISAAKGAIKKLNDYLQEKGANKRSMEHTELLDNEDVTRLRQNIAKLQDQYVATGNSQLLTQVDLLNKQIEQYIERIVDREKIELNDFSGHIDENLETQLIGYQLDLIQSENRARSIRGELGALNRRRDLLTKDINKVRLLERKLESANKDYQEAKESRNFSKSILDKAYHPLAIVEYAQVPDKPESSHRMLITAFSGIVGGCFSTALILLLAFLDMSLNTPHQFRKFTRLSLVGGINEIKKSNVDLHDIFSKNGRNPALTTFKESVRSIRYAMEQSGGKTFLFSSTQHQSGKTFLMVTLAYAMTLKQKKVLLIDTNFKNNTLTQMSEKAHRDNLLTTRLIGKNNLDDDFESKTGIGKEFSIDHVDIIGNHGGVNSPAEILAGKNFKAFIEELSQSYDYIFLESAAMNQYADTQELLEYVDKVILVFSADSVIKETDKRSISFLKKLNNKLLGAILNKLDLVNMN